MRVVDIGRKKRGGGGKVAEGLVRDLFKQELCEGGFFKNVDVAANTQHATRGHATVYVTMPGVLNALKKAKAQRGRPA